MVTAGTLPISSRHPQWSGTYINHLLGLQLEEQALAGLADDSPSPYEGLTAGQARQAITDEREELPRMIDQAPGLDVIITTRPELLERYMERFRLMGEHEATKWWLDTTGDKE